MKLVVVAVFDRATQAHGRPIFVHAKGQAIRSFQDEINRNAADNEMHRHPEDYDLFYLGEFDDATGLFNGSGPELLLRGKEAVRGVN